MRKQLICAISAAASLLFCASGVQADSKTLLSKVPDKYKWAVCIDSKQFDASSQLMVDIIDKIVPEEKKAEFQKGRDARQEFKNKIAELGIGPDTLPYVCVFGMGHSEEMEGLMLIETLMPEDALAKALGDKVSEAGTVEGRKLYVAKPGNGRAKKMHADSICFAYLDPELIILAKDKESIASYMAESKAGIKSAKFYGQEALDKNPVVWIGTNPAVASSEANCKDATLAVSLDTAGKSILAEGNAIMLDAEAAQMTASMAQMCQTMALKGNKNDVISSNIKIGSSGDKISVSLKIDEELLKTVADSLRQRAAAKKAQKENNGLSIEYKN